MNYQHKNLANGKWLKLSFAHQMANVGSEVFRALKWQEENKDYSKQAFYRALELLDLTIQSHQKSFTKLRELTRLREVLVDYFYGSNQYASSPKLWQSYFLAFNYLARLK